jgi:hypothetical protein
VLPGLRFQQHPFMMPSSKICMLVVRGSMVHSPGQRSGMRGHAAFHPDVFMSLAPDVVLLSLWSPARDWFGFPMLSADYAEPAHLMPGYFQPCLPGHPAAHGIRRKWRSRSHR